MLHADPFVPALFILAIIQRWCIACISRDPLLYELHVCRSNVDRYMQNYGEISCYIFGLVPNKQNLDNIYQFLLSNTYD